MLGDWCVIRPVTAPLVMTLPCTLPSTPNTPNTPQGSYEGNVLVGIDASGLELRMLAHYMDDENYTNELLNGDIHTANQREHYPHPLSNMNGTQFRTVQIRQVLAPC